MSPLNAYYIGTLISTMVASNADLGDWLCKMLGICV